MLEICQQDKTLGNSVSINPKLLPMFRFHNTLFLHIFFPLPQLNQVVVVVVVEVVMLLHPHPHPHHKLLLAVSMPPHKQFLAHRRLWLMLEVKQSFRQALQ
jgi:hypothetical protein